MCAGRAASLFPSVPAEAGCLFTVAAGVHVFISGESLHCFLVGWCTNKSYVIATSDLWLFIHASNLLSLNSPPHSPTHLFKVVDRMSKYIVTIVLFPTVDVVDHFGVKLNESLGKVEVDLRSTEHTEV